MLFHFRFMLSNELLDLWFGDSRAVKLERCPHDREAPSSSRKLSWNIWIICFIDVLGPAVTLSAINIAEGE